MHQRKLLPLVLGLLLLTLSSPNAPVFNKNFVFKTWSSNAEITLLCVPTHCINETDGCISMYRKKAPIPYWQFPVQDIAGSVFLPSDDGQAVLQVQLYRGFSLFAYDFRNQSEETIRNTFSYIKLHRAGSTDSVRLPRVLVVKDNARFILSKGEISPGLVLKLKGDSVSFITGQGVYRFWMQDLTKVKAFTGFGATTSGYKPLRLSSNNRCSYDLVPAFEECKPVE